MGKQLGKLFRKEMDADTLNRELGIPWPRSIPGGILAVRGGIRDDEGLEREHRHAVQRASVDKRNNENGPRLRRSK